MESVRLESVRLLGLDFDSLEPSAAAAVFARRPAKAPFAYVVTPNSDHFVRLSKRPDLWPLYNRSQFRLLDSRVIASLCKLLRIPAPAVCPGSDLTRILFEKHIHPTEPITIIGLAPEWRLKLAAMYNLSAVAHYYPPFGFEDNPVEFARVLDFVEAHPARFIFLAVGSPRQEKIALALVERGKCTGLGLCIGASLEFLSGKAQRAPEWVQRVNMEWAYRMMKAPRLARRYLIDCPAILPLLWKSR